MANITLSIPEDLHRKLKARKEIKWSEVMRQTLENSLNKFEMAENVLKKSKFTKEDVEELSLKIDSSVAEKLNLK